uniref:Uncharacterized protein n=1 Tax=Romanomermis culicivorax TaxID=13658 RepID=A0A915KC97_ROMCU
MRSNWAFAICNEQLRAVRKIECRSKQAKCKKSNQYLNIGHVGHMIGQMLRSATWHDLPHGTVGYSAYNDLIKARPERR